MKLNLLKLSVFSLFFCVAFFAKAQYVSDTGRVVVSDTVINTPITYDQQDASNMNANYDTHFYKWETPVFDIVDINRL